MNVQAIFHQPKSNYCFAYNKNTVEIRLRAAKGDLDKVFLTYGDKYDWDNNKNIEMKLKYSDSFFDYFEVSIIPPNNRLSYYFNIECGEDKLYYTEWGVVRELNKNEIHLLCFHYPYVNEVDIHKVPEWVKDAVFYQIFPERFNNGDKSNDPECVEQWGELPKTDNFFGGDLKGIIDKVDYLNELGINAIYLTPVFESTTNHKYNTTDYFKIDSHFGDKETLKELVKKCHEKGIRVVLDAVFNHSGYNFAPFQDVIEKGENSLYYDWFHIRKYPIEINPPSYETFAFEYKMPKLNTENKEVKEYILKAARYWIEECDIDGWRLDVANEIDHNFWREFRKAVKEVKKDAYVVGEIWHDSLPWLMGDQFDAIMNYPLTRACIQYFAYENIKHKEFKELVDNTFIRNTRQVNEVMLNLLDSHDTSRILTKCNGDINKLMLTAVFMLTYVGAPCIYYGTEIGMEGGEDPDCRRCMEWNQDNWNEDLYKFYKNIIHIRKNHEALRRGSFKWIKGLDGIVGYIRETSDEKIIVLINNSSDVMNIEFKVDFAECVDLVEDKMIQEHGDKVKLTMNQYSYKILCVK